LDHHLPELTRGDAIRAICKRRDLELGQGYLYLTIKVTALKANGLIKRN
jgi:hypothetical protein